MNRDIKIKYDDICFVYRVAAIIIHNNRVLLQKTKGFDYTSFIGGKCQVGENSIDAAIREVKEETGIECEYIETKGIIENFFHSVFDNDDRHEIDIFVSLKIKDEKYLNMDKINNIENNSYEQHYEWYDLDKLDEINLKPSIGVDVIRSKELLYKIHKG